MEELVAPAPVTTLVDFETLFTAISPSAHRKSEVMMLKLANKEFFVQEQRSKKILADRTRCAATSCGMPCTGRKKLRHENPELMNHESTIRANQCDTHTYHYKSYAFDLRRTHHAFHHN